MGRMHQLMQRLGFCRFKKVEKHIEDDAIITNFGCYFHLALLVE
jgi:hypothetical protein